MKQQMNKAISRYLQLETKCNSLKSELHATKKQCLQFENLCCKLKNDLNATQIDLTQREMELKQTISDELCANANGRDKALKEYLHNHLKKIIEETIARYQKNDLYQNQVF